MDPALNPPPPPERPAAPRFWTERWIAPSQAVARALVLVLACAVLVHGGALAVELPPWAALALPLGAGLGAALRWGRPMLLAALAGTVLGLLMLGHSPWVAGLLPLPGGLATLAAARVLAARRFDTRLDRPADVTALTAGSLVVYAPLAALLTWGVSVLATSGAPGLATAATLPGAAPGFDWTGWAEASLALLAGWASLGLGGLVTAVAVLALDRRALHPLQPAAPWREPLAACASLPLLWLLMALLAPHPWAAPLMAALPLPALVVLVLRGHLALAALALLGAFLLLAGNGVAPTQVLTPTLSGPAGLALACWLGGALGLLLGLHATMVQWRSRAKRWEWALDASRLGVADWPAGAEEGFASMAWRSLTNHGPGAWRPDAWLQQVHEEDRPAMQAALDALTQGQAGRQQLELRMPDGPGWRWTETTLLVTERDSDGLPTRFLATLSDVQDRREAQERKRMSASLFQHLHEGLLITDADLRALDANPAYTQILGVEREELLGTVPSLLRPTPADPIARQQRAAMWASLSNTGSWRGELIERRRNGELCTLRATISTVPGPTHDLRYHVLVISDITEQRVQREQLERQAHFDELTRLPNRARLSQLLDDAMKAADRDGYLLAVCYLDLDRFKPVNDRYGHAAGDRLLAELAGRLRSALRSRETWVDSAARLGGDEFVLLLRAGTLEEARLAVERVLRVVALPYVVDPAAEAVHVTASMGATVYPIDRSDADTLLRHADHAMYGAKQAGRNGYLFFDPEHRRRTEERVMAIGRVQEALDSSEFVLHYQPKVDMKTGRVHGFEALLRWDHPQQGQIAPLQFLPLIEHTGLSSRVGDWVLAQALEHLSQWRRSGLDINVSVNVSARHLQEPDFALRLSELLARHKEPLAAHLELEMLETAAHADIEATSALVSRCQALGVRFALDDFGTGYSTLTYLKRLPVDVLKIDRSFVHHMLDDAQDRAIVEGVIGLAGTFGCVVVAEGVESPAQARTLIELGCGIGQGTGIAAPMPADRVAAWTREYRGMFALGSAEGAARAAATDHPRSLDAGG
jgi:diguanylate cyclase (GGDEF)-like protein/PAS domain S-box-containing protein